MTTFLNDMFQTISERGRALLERRGLQVDRGGADLVKLCESLVSTRGEASGVAIASEVLRRYDALPSDRQVDFLRSLAEQFGADDDRLVRAIHDYMEDPNGRTAGQVHFAAEPRRQELIRRLNLAPAGTASLVSMRVQILDNLREYPELALLDEDFRHLFASWFNRGFLVLRRIDWATPASILAKIIKYEAVHQIADWEDLRRRLEPADRRCFAFFHPALVDDPLIFVEVALTPDIPASIAEVLATERKITDPMAAKTAAFYSISNCQKGLRGISFGNFLIKQVVEDLVREAPQLETFVTLSPAPGFRDWLDRERRAEGPSAATDADRATLAALDADDWHKDAEKVQAIKRVIMPLAAHYFFRAKDDRGRPIDPVARFHLGNGARLERINWLGDVSAKGLTQARGLMVNYRYVLKDVERNHEAFANAGEIAASSHIRRQLRSNAQPQTPTPADE